MSPARQDRKAAILQTLASMLEEAEDARITTAALARQVGVTEAALYRHYPSKHKMLEGLVSFAEEAVFSRCQVILEEQQQVRPRVDHLLRLVLTFAERNPGVCRILTGEALTGEDQRLRQRTDQFFERLEVQLRQILKEGEWGEGTRYPLTVNRTAAQLMGLLEGRLHRFVRSRFRHRPLEDWDEAWEILGAALLGHAPVT